MIPGSSGNWSCLQPTPEIPRTPGGTGEMVVYSLRLVDLATDQPYRGVSVRACGLTDISCDEPIGPTLSDDEGWVFLRLIRDFSGFLEISVQGAVPYVFHLPDPLRETMTDYPLAMIGLESFLALLDAFELGMNRELGAIGVRAFDCFGTPASGVTLTSNPPGVPWYFEAGLPSVLRDRTDAYGLGGFLGLPQGVSQLSAALPNGRIFSSRQVIVRANWMTAGYLRPTFVAQ